jgi:hypothetical protein
MRRHEEGNAEEVRKVVMCHNRTCRDVIFPILKDRSARHYCCACGIFNFFNFRHFLVGWFQYSYLNNVESPLGYVACFLTWSFDVLSVIRRLHNLWSPFKIPFYLVPPIVFSFRAHAFYFLGTIRRIFVEWHIEGSMISAVWTHLWMFLKSKSCHFVPKTAKL